MWQVRNCLLRRIQRPRFEKAYSVFYVTIGSPNNEDEVTNSTNYMRKALSEYYGQEMNGCCLTFILRGADAGSSIMDFGGELVQMAQINSGIATDIRDGDGNPLKPCPQI